jgi:hypothetical protein
MGRMKELFMDQQEQQRFEATLNAYDGPREDPEDAYYAQMAEENAMWDQVAEEHDAHMQSVLDSGIPVHLLESYGYPGNLNIIDELPWTCQVCSDPVATGNEYCGQECGKVYHERKRNEKDLPF